MTENTLSLDKQLCFPIYAASHLINRLYRPLLDELGVTYPQYLVLLVLWEQQAEMTVGEVCQRLQLDSGTVTPLLKRLETAGLLRRVRSKEDERRVMISLTSEGNSLRLRAEHIPNTLSCQMGISSDEIVHLRQQLHSFLAKLERPN